MDLNSIKPPKSFVIRRNFALDLIRSVAIIGIFFFHLDPDSILKPLFTRLGDIGIVVFIAVSGYVLGMKYLQERISFKDFITKRFVRIIPAYWISLFLILLARYLLHNRIYPLSDILVHVLGLHALFPAYAHSISSNLWFVSLILFLYFCFPFAAKYLVRYNSLVITLVLVITHFVLLYIFDHVDYLHHYLEFKGIAYKYPLFIFNLLPFIFGAVCADLDRKGKTLYKILIALLVATYFSLVHLDNSAIGIMVFVCSLFVKKDMRFTPISYFAKYSYEFYLLHQVAMTTMAYYFYKYIHSNWVLFSMAYGIFVFIGAIFVQKASSILVRFLNSYVFA